MKRNINNAKLDKNFILSKISQISIFSAYLGLSEEDIKHCIDTGELIISPLRYDRHPTCGFRYDNRGKLKFKDFAGFIWGDCFDIAAYVISYTYNRSIDITNKKDFISVLKHIAFTFGNIIYGNEKDENVLKDLSIGRDNIKKSKPIIEFVVREWNKYDIEYWEKGGVDLNWLNINFIYAVDQYYINRKTNPQPKYIYDKKDPCYAYITGRDNKGIHDVKLYFPKRNKHYTKFITNYNHLEGIYNLERDDYDYIIITKSTKDRVALSKMLWMMSSFTGDELKAKIGTINIPAENYKLSTAEYYWLYNKLAIKDSKRLICLMDNDKSGYLEAIYLRDEFGMLPIYIPKIYNAKDFFELRSIYGFNKCKEFIIETYNKIDDYVTRNQSIRNKETNDIMPF